MLSIDNNSALSDADAARFPSSIYVADQSEAVIGLQPRDRRPLSEPRRRPLGNGALHGKRSLDGRKTVRHGGRVQRSECGGTAAMRFSYFIGSIRRQQALSAENKPDQSQTGPSGNRMRTGVRGSQN
jgi:hypothetical protein